MDKPAAGLWRNNPETPEGKYLVRAKTAIHATSPMIPPGKEMAGCCPKCFMLISSGDCKCASVPAARVKLPPLDVCPEELKHGYPDCQCDPPGTDPSCTKRPTFLELHQRYGQLNQRERQLEASLAANAALEKENVHLKEQIDDDTKEMATLKARLAALEEFWDCALSQSVGLRYNYETKIVTNERAEKVEAQLAAIRAVKVEMPKIRRYLTLEYCVSSEVAAALDAAAAEIAKLELALSLHCDLDDWRSALADESRPIRPA